MKTPTMFKYGWYTNFMYILECMLCIDGFSWRPRNNNEIIVCSTNMKNIYITCEYKIFHTIEKHSTEPLTHAETDTHTQSINKQSIFHFWERAHMKIWWLCILFLFWIAILH